MHGCMKNDDFRPISRSISDLSRSAVAKRPRDASCLLVSFSSTKRRAESSYVTNNHIKTESFRYISTAYLKLLYNYRISCFTNITGDEKKLFSKVTANNSMNFISAVSRPRLPRGDLVW